MYGNILVKRGFDLDIHTNDMNRNSYFFHLIVIFSFTNPAIENICYGTTPGMILNFMVANISQCFRK